MKLVTLKFARFLRDQSLEPRTSTVPVKEEKYLPERSLVLQGSQIFTIFNEGTEIEFEGEKVGLQNDFLSIQETFEHVLLDIAACSNDRQRTNVEVWFEIIKKVLRMKNEQVEDFYVFVCDQPETKKNAKTYERVLSFWCFNAGVGFQKLVSLQPRSIILTSGTLSPLTALEAELQVKFPI